MGHLVYLLEQVKVENSADSFEVLFEGLSKALFAGGILLALSDDGSGTRRLNVFRLKF